MVLMNNKSRQPPHRAVHSNILNTLIPQKHLNKPETNSITRKNGSQLLNLLSAHANPFPLSKLINQIIAHIKENLTHTLRVNKLRTSRLMLGNNVASLIKKLILILRKLKLRRHNMIKILNRIRHPEHGNLSVMNRIRVNLLSIKRQRRHKTSEHKIRPNLRTEYRTINITRAMSIGKPLGSPQKP